MNTFKNILLTLVIVLTTQTLFAQNEHEAPEPPEPPEHFEFDFDFDMFHKMSEDDEKELLKNLNATLKEEMKVIKNFNKQKYFELLRESQFKNMKIPFLVKREKIMHEREKKIFELQVKTESLAAKFKTAREAEKATIKRQLKNDLSKLFDEKEERRKQEIKALENELKELQNSLAARQKNKQVIIERRIQELLDEDQYLEWD